LQPLNIDPPEIKAGTLLDSRGRLQFAGRGLLKADQSVSRSHGKGAHSMPTAIGDNIRTVRDHYDKLFDPLDRVNTY
jgi:hypothetical protein